MTNSSGDSEVPGSPSSSPGHTPEPLTGAGAGVAAVQQVDLTEEEGEPSQHAQARFSLGERVEAAFSFKLSSPIMVLLLAVVGCVGLGYFSWAMTRSPHAGWIVLGSAVMACGVLAGAGWFARHLVDIEQRRHEMNAEVRSLFGRTLTTNKTVNRAANGSGRKKRGGSSRSRRRRQR